MYLSKIHTKSSLPTIGEKFGGKNHATVIHSIKIINKAISQNNNFNLEIKTIEEKIIT
jgi:chromosomal replication initiator protein